VFEVTVFESTVFGVAVFEVTLFKVAVFWFTVLAIELVGLVTMVLGEGVTVW